MIDMLTAEQIGTIREARAILVELAGKCRDATYSTSADVRYADPTIRDYARVEAMSEVAENAIFDAMNCLSSYRVQQLTRDQLHLTA